LADLSGRGCTAIVVSGMPESNLSALSLSLRAYDFIEKPVDSLVLQTKVEQGLNWEVAAGAAAASVSRWPAELAVDSDRPPNLRWRGELLHLTITELSIVYCLVAVAGKAVDYAKLSRAMKSAVSQAVLTTHVRGVRKKFLDIDPKFDRIDVEPGKGYVWKTGN
jgi:DNA-binding response OmpR family regulator